MDCWGVDVFKMCRWGLCRKQTAAVTGAEGAALTAHVPTTLRVCSAHFGQLSSDCSSRTVEARDRCVGSGRLHVAALPLLPAGICDDVRGLCFCDIPSSSAGQPSASNGARPLSEWCQPATVRFLLLHLTRYKNPRHLRHDEGMGRILRPRQQCCCCAFVCCAGA